MEKIELRGYGKFDFMYPKLLHDYPLSDHFLYKLKKIRIFLVFN